MQERNLSYKCCPFTKLSWITNPARYHQLSWCCVLVSIIFLSGCSDLFGMEFDSVSPTVPFTFKQYDVVTGTAKHQTVLTGSLLGGTIADLAVLNIDAEGNRRLHIYTFDDDNWKSKLDMMLGAEVLFVDIANIGGRDRLVMYENGRLNWFDPESATEHTLVTVISDVPPPHGEIPHLDITRDLNADNRDDLVVPNTDGFWIFLQTEAGAFTDPVKIGPSIETSRIYAADGYRYNPWETGNIHEIDYDQDGRCDLIFWNEDHFVIHYQNAHGLFSSEAETFTMEVPFDSDDLALLVAPDGVRGRRFDHGAPGAMTGRVLHALTDMNRDGIADLSIFSLQAGKGRLLGQTSELWGMQSAYEVHFGAPTSGGITFATEASTTIRSDGIPFDLGQQDFDHDGQIDMTFAIIDPGIFKVIGMLASGILTESVSLDLHLYRMAEGSYPSEPDAVRKIKTHSPGDSGEKAMHFPSLLFGDVNGDGRADLLVQHGGNELRIFIGVPGPDLFVPKPQKVAVNMPYEEYTWLVDLNKDGVQDVFMHHPSITKPHRVTMLIAQ